MRLTETHKRREWFWLIGAVAALALGATCGAGYSRLATPYYATVAAWIATLHPWNAADRWEITEVAVRNEPDHGSALRLTADMYRNRDDKAPTARVVTRLRVGEVVEAPLVFWTLLVLWPAPCLRRRLTYLAAGIPLFLCLEAATTASQLVQSMPAISAMVAGESDPHSAWERWSGFLESGGRFMMETAAALLTVGIVEALRPRSNDIHPSTVPASNCS